MRSNLRAVILSFFILASVFFGVGETKTAQAAVPFPGFLPSTATEIIPNVYNLPVTTVFKQDDKSFIIDVTLVGTPAPEDTGSKLNELDSSDNFGAWEWFVHKDRQENTFGTEGVFLLVGTAKANISTNYNGSPFAVATGDFNYTVKPLIVADGNGTKTIVPQKANNVFVFAQGKTFATNIGAYFWRSDPINRFFKKTTVSAAKIQVDGLTPNTTYYVQIGVKENVITSATHPVRYIALSNVIPITTLTTPAAQAANVDLTDEATNSYQETISQVNLTQGNKTLSEKIDCWKREEGDVFPTLYVAGCVAELFNDALVPLAVRVNRLTGQLFDGFAAVSIGSTIYGQGAAGEGIGAFVEQSWSTVRDISNIFFIFILLYAALGLVLSMHHIDTKKLIAQVIIIALIINFSLFFCRVTIDTSNVLSRVFYNAMDVSSKGNAPATTSESGAVEQPISSAIIEGIQPQKILSPETLEKIDGGNASILLVLIISFILNLVMAWVFFMCAAFFAGRVGVIWFSMIFAPLAFVSSIVPGLDKNLKQLGWHNWLSSFMKACFNAPIFFFFLYLIVNLVGGGPEGMLGKTMIAVTNTSNESLYAFLIGILLPTMILVGLLMAAKKIAEEMAGEFGGAFAGIVAAGAGLGAMAITGGAAVLGRSTIGAASARFANPESKIGNKMRDIAAGKVTTGFGSTGLGKWAARQGVKGTEAGKKSSFDVRNTGIANSLSKVTGVDMNVGAKIPLVSTALGSFSTANTAGGFDGKVARQAEKDRKFTDLLGYDKNQHDATGKAIEKKEDDISKQEDIVEELQGLVAAAKAGGGSAVDPITGATFTTKMAQDELNDQRNILRTLKKGGDKTNPAHVWSAADAAPGSTAVKADGTKVTSADVGQLKTDYIGIDKLKKAQENIKTSRAKEYYNNRIIKSGAEVHDREKRDSLGNITKLAHADNTKIDLKQYGKNILRDFASAGLPAIAGGVLVAGPIGALAGAGFGLARVLRSATEGLGQMRHEVAHLASDTSHQIHRGSSSYKSPTSGFTDMFKGLGSSGGEHAAPDHGGGGGDHH